MKKPPKPSKAPAPFSKERKDLIKKLISKIDYTVFPREMKMAGQLFELIPDAAFWAQFEPPKFIGELDSLRIFMGEWGQDYLRKQFNLYNHIKENEIVKPIEPRGLKVGEDYKIIPKSKQSNLLEFLKS